MNTYAVHSASGELLSNFFTPDGAFTFARAKSSGGGRTTILRTGGCVKALAYDGRIYTAVGCDVCAGAGTRNMSTMYLTYTAACDACIGYGALRGAELPS